MTFKKNQISNIFSITVIFILTFAVYFQLSGHEFLILDDNTYVTNNPRVQSGLSLENIIWAFKSFEAEFWHPVTWISYMTDTSLYGVIPGGYLFTNLFLHLINAILVFYLFLLITQKQWESFFISALFALHPIHVEAVAWIAERKELLCGFFWLTATIAYCRYTQTLFRKYYFSALILFLLGIMSKSMIVTLPFTFLLLDFWPLNRIGFQTKETFKRLSRLIIEKIPFFLISAAGSAVTLAAQGQGGGIVSLEKFSAGQRMANSMESYLHYIKNTFWPENLSVFYPVKDIEPFVIVLSVLCLILLTGIFLFYFKKHPFLITGWFWFAGTLVPVIGIVKIGDFAMADRFMYMPVIGLLMILVFGTGQLISGSPYKTTWKIIIPLLILGSYIPNTFFQIKNWKDSETLFYHALSSVENNFLAHHGLGELYAGRGDMNKAAFHFSKAVEYKPDKAILWIKQGRAFYAIQLKEKAIASFQKALALSSTHYAPHFYLLCAYLDIGRVDEAKYQFDQMIDKFIRQNKLIGKEVFAELLNGKTDYRLLIVRGHESFETQYLKTNLPENMR